MPTTPGERIILSVNKEDGHWVYQLRSVRALLGEHTAHIATLNPYLSSGSGVNAMEWGQWLVVASNHHAPMVDSVRELANVLEEMPLSVGQQSVFQLARHRLQELETDAVREDGAATANDLRHLEGQLLQAMAVPADILAGGPSRRELLYVLEDLVEYARHCATERDERPRCITRAAEALKRLRESV